MDTFGSAPEWGLSSPATTPAMVWTIRNDMAPGLCFVVSSGGFITVCTYNANGIAADKEFSVIVFGK